MNKIDQERIERRIRSMEESPYHPTDDRIEEIKQRAFEEYNQFLRTNEKRHRRKNKKRSILLRVVAVTALAFCFLISSFVYSVVTPVTVANANNLVRRVAIWINNQLQLGISFPNPVDDEEMMQLEEERHFTSISDLSDVFHEPIAYIPETDMLKIESIEAVNFNHEWLVTIRYLTSDKQPLTIKLESYFESNAIGIESKYTSAISTSLGKLYIWTDEVVNYAVCFSSSNIISITASMPMESFMEYCQNLVAFN